MTMLAHETLIEHQIMEHIKEALRLALDARGWPSALGRKLASVRFMADSFERHFLRLLDLEEDGGYMLAECERAPQLSAQVTALREEHTEFRQELDQTLQALRLQAGDDEGRFEGLCRTLQSLLERIDVHDAKEVELLEQLLLAKPVGQKQCDRCGHLNLTPSVVCRPAELRALLIEPEPRRFARPVQFARASTRAPARRRTWRLEAAQFEQFFRPPQQIDA